MGKAGKKRVKSEEKEPVSASKQDIKHKIAAKVEEVESSPALITPFDVNDLHKKALVKLFYCHHVGQVLTYQELSAEIGMSEKTKRWQCEAWKDLKTNEYIVSASGGLKDLKLSEKGMALAKTFLSDEELADYRMPATNEEHHAKIKSKLSRDPKAAKYGPKIFQLLLDTNDDPPMTRHELAGKFNCLADSHGFFYGLKALLGMGLVCKVKGVSGAKRSKKTKKTKEEEENAVDEKGENDEENDKSIKKKKKREGGQPLKLTDKAFLATAQAKEVATPDGAQSNMKIEETTVKIEAETKVKMEVEANVKIEA